jgi:hypothetical protein
MSTCRELSEWDKIVWCFESIVCDAKAMVHRSLALYRAGGEPRLAKVRRLVVVVRLIRGLNMVMRCGESEIIRCALGGLCEKCCVAHEFYMSIVSTMRFE